MDRGFCGIDRLHPNKMTSLYPAVVKDREKGGVGLTRDEVVSSAEQSSDRYTCEVVYRRVKVFDILHGHLPRKFLSFLTPAWYVGHMFAQYYNPLRESVAWSQREYHMQAAVNLGPLYSSHTC